MYAHWIYNTLNSHKYFYHILSQAHMIQLLKFEVGYLLKWEVKYCSF